MTLAWHFAPSSMTTAHTNEPIVVGETLTCAGPPVLCARGLHASVRVIDALTYAPAKTCLCRVVVGGELGTGDDKIAGTERTVLWALDAATTDRVLREFACRVAEQALQRPGVNDPRLWGAIHATRAWMRGEIDANALAAARAAAWDAAWDAARDAQPSLLAALATAAHEGRDVVQGVTR